MAQTSVVTWNDFPAQKPAAIYERGQSESSTFHFVQIEGGQVIVLRWHANLSPAYSRWEWLMGSVFHGTVLKWATEPTL